jgi:hypothetical protein
VGKRVSIGAREPIGEGAYHRLARRGGGKNRCSSDMQERERREGKGNSPYQGPSGTSGKITGHKEMRVDERSGGG